ncbi:MAG: hypothetical protein ACIAQF_07550 [Phycisphaerales bacterium JB065]
MKSRISAACVVASLAGFGTSVVSAGPIEICPTWDTTIGQPGAEGGSVSGLERIGDEIFIGGGFSSVAGMPNTTRLARYNVLTGEVSGLGTAVPDNFVAGFFTYDDGNGEQVYICGSFNSVTVDGNELPNSKGLVRWDGTKVSAIPGSPFTGTFDFMWDGLDYNGLLVTGGNGGYIDGGGIVQKPTFATWDGTTWTTWSNEFGGLVAPVIIELAEYKGDVYFAGRFSSFDADPEDPNNPIVESNNIMRWDGTNFSSVGGGVFRATSIVSQVLALEVFDDGSGEKLYVGGRFDRLGSQSGTVSPTVARWDGSQWEALPGFPQAGREVRDFEVYNGELYAVGNFEQDNLGMARKFAKWTGSSWVEVGDGFGGAAGDENPSAIAATDRGFLIGGAFTSAGNGTAPGAGSATGLVEWVVDCGGDCVGDANGDNSVDLADLNLVLANFGSATSNGDVDGSGTVDLADLNLVLANFGKNC